MAEKKTPPQPITLRVNEDLVAALKELQSTGLFGKSINETAERLLSDAIAKRFPRKLSRLGIKP